MRPWHVNVPIPSVIRAVDARAPKWFAPLRVLNAAPATALFPLHTGERPVDRHACEAHFNPSRTASDGNGRRTVRSVGRRNFPTRSSATVATIRHTSESAFCRPAHGFRSAQAGSWRRKLRLLASITVSCAAVTPVNTLVRPRICPSPLHAPAASTRARRLPVEPGFCETDRRK